MIRYAVIGTGKIVTNFLEAALRVPDMEFTALYSRREETGRAFLAPYGQKKCYTSLEELAMDEEVDAVYIASPNSRHCSQAIQLLEAGKHILCEKPVALNCREFLRMKEAAAHKGVVFMEAMRPVYDQGFFKLKEAVKKAGKVRQAVFQYCQYSSRYDNFKEGIVENAFNPRLGNAAIMDIGIYCAAPMVRLFGKPESLKADSIFLENGFEGAGTIVAHYKDFQVILLYSKINQQNLCSQIQGEEATVLINSIQDIREITLHYRSGEKEKLTAVKDKNNMLYEIQEWKRLMEEGCSNEQELLYTEWEMEVLDEARRQAGISFEIPLSGHRSE